ncbi:hypothetical protein JOM56_014693 [Amanita muscaria]
MSIYFTVWDRRVHRRDDRQPWLSTWRRKHENGTAEWLKALEQLVKLFLQGTDGHLLRELPRGQNGYPSNLCSTVSHIQSYCSGSRWKTVHTTGCRLARMDFCSSIVSKAKETAELGQRAAPIRGPAILATGYGIIPEDNTTIMFTSVSDFEIPQGFDWKLESRYKPNIKDTAILTGSFGFITKSHTVDVKLVKLSVTAKCGTSQTYERLEDLHRVQGDFSHQKVNTMDHGTTTCDGLHVPTISMRASYQSVQVFKCLCDYYMEYKARVNARMAEANAMTIEERPRVHKCCAAADLGYFLLSAFARFDTAITSGSWSGQMCTDRFRWQQNSSDKIRNNCTTTCSE